MEVARRLRSIVRGEDVVARLAGLEGTEAALSALRSFGARCEPLRARVVVLLRRALHDADDEVRDRAALYLHELEKEVKEVDGAASPEAPSTPPRTIPDAPALVEALRAYLDAGETEEAFDLSAVRAATRRTPGRVEISSKIRCMLRPGGMRSCRS